MKCNPTLCCAVVNPNPTTMTLLLTVFLFISLGNVSYQVAGESTGRNQYKFNNYVCDIYNSEYVDYYSPGGRKGVQTSWNRLGNDYGVTAESDVDFEDGDENEPTESDFDIFLMVPNGEDEQEASTDEIQDQDEDEDDDETFPLASRKSTADKKLNDNRSLSTNTISNEELAKEMSVDESTTNKAKREDDASWEDNEVTSPQETCTFSFDDFETYEIDQTRLEKLRNQVMIILDQRRNKQKNQTDDTDDKKDQANEKPDSSRNNQQTSNIIKDMIHKNVMRRGYPGEEYDENMMHKPRPKQPTPNRMDRLRSALSGRFRPRHSLLVETSPASAKFTLTGTRTKLENPKVYVIDNKDRVKGLDEFCVADQHAVLEDSLKNSNLYLCYPAKVKIRENEDDRAEVVVMKTVVKSMLDRCADSFFHSNVGRIFAKRFYNLIIL